MKYFDYLKEGGLYSLFCRQPQPFSKRTKRSVLRVAVGGLLYIPGADERISDIIIKRKIPGAASVAICLEDSVGDEERESSIKNVQYHLDTLSSALKEGRLTQDTLPLLFVRVKDNRMLGQLADYFVKRSDVLTGVILPKVSEANLENSLNLVSEIAEKSAEPFYAMPILESDELVLCENRVKLLQRLREMIDRYEDLVLNIRIGATDLCGLYGIRRGVDTPIYSVMPVAACIADVVRVFAFKDRYTVSGPVWEYFSTLTRARAFENWDELTGLMRELKLDLVNGILGKTCVHPSQLLPVQASYAVNYEAYRDAECILFGGQGRKGVLSSAKRNKMNEVKPHMLWAEKIMRRAEVYGVYQENLDSAGFLRALYSRESFT